MSKIDRKTTFKHYTSSIEQIPFSDSEALEILGIGIKEISSGLRSGLIKKSISIHYRYDLAFSFLGLFDLFEYSLRKEFFFLVYGKSPEIHELVCSLVDEIACIIDDQITDGNDSLTMDRILASLKHLCNESQETWNKYWLRNGERFSAEVCASLTLNSWCSLFDLSMSAIGGGFNPPQKFHLA